MKYVGALEKRPIIPADEAPDGDRLVRAYTTIIIYHLLMTILLPAIGST